MKNQFLLTCILLLSLLVIGCQKQEEITQHEVPKELTGLQFLRGGTNQAEVASEPSNLLANIGVRSIPDEESTDRMVVGIVQREDLMWFFKMQGSIEAMGQSEDQWKPFIEAVRFEDSQPVWELPEGWTEGPTRPMRTATLVLEEFSPPLEMAISNLSPDQDLLLNVNRWRGQMGQPPIDQTEIGSNLQPLESEFGTAYLFDIKGQFSGGMMPNLDAGSQAPFAGGRSRPNLSQSSRGGTANQVPKFTRPTGWQTGNTSSMVPIRLEKSDNDQSVQITVVPLPAAANQWEPNAVRWAEEVELGDYSAEKLLAYTTELSVDGNQGQVLKLIPEESSKPRGLVAAMIKRGDTAWFVKLSGDKSLVEASESEFQEFLNSLKFSL